MLPQLQPLLLVYSRFQLLPGLGLGGCKCPGICPFLPGLLVYVHEVSDGSLYFCGISGNSPCIVFLLPLFNSSLLSFLLIWLAVCLLFWPFQKTSSSISCFLKVLCLCISFGSALSLVISHLLLAFEFV